MKFRLTATIAIYFLFTLLLSTLYAHASRDKIFEQKWKLFFKILVTKQKLQQNTLAQNLPQNLQLFTKTNPSEKNGSAEITTIAEFSISQKLQQTADLSSSSLLLFLIVNPFLTCKDILVLRTSCKMFQNLLQPNHANMVTFRNSADSQHMTETAIIWDDLKNLQNCNSAFDKMELFNIKENLYAVLTSAPEKKIIAWNNYLTQYPQILIHEITKNTPFENQHNSYASNSFGPLLKKVFNKEKNAWATITKEENVTTGGDEQDGGDSSNVQSQLKNVKTIFSTKYAFVALLNNNCVVAWGNERFGGKIPDDIQSQLKNVKIISSTYCAFVALLKDGRVFAWGSKNWGGIIPHKTQTQLTKNVTKMIFSTHYAFAALLNNGRVITWGHEDYGGKIPDYTQKKLTANVIKTIFSTRFAFAALLNNGCVVAWGIENWGGKIPDKIHKKLNNVTKMIFSTRYAFAALLNNGCVVAWGNENWGGKIPDKIQVQLNNVTKMIFSTDYAFAALLNNGCVVAWGHEIWGGKIPDKIQVQLQNVKTIIPNTRQFTAVCINGDTFTW